MIRIDLQNDRSADDSREWLETDGRGGYASSTLTDRHTRRYHGLYVANLREPEGRYVLLSKLEDSLRAEGEEHFFSSHRYPGVLFPDPSLLDGFLLDLCPAVTSRAGATIVKRSLLMPRDQGGVMIRYDLERCPPGALLRLKPFLAFRGFHTLSYENGFLNKQTEALENGFRITPYAGLPSLVFQTSRSSVFTPAPHWYNRFQYSEEHARGFESEEDLFLPGIIEIAVERKCSVILTVISGEDAPGRRPGPTNAAAVWKTELIRRGRDRSTGHREIDRFAGEDRELVATLFRAGRQFLITTPSGRPAIIAGYPWFGSWGRDTLISLPGLCFATGRVAEGIAILTEIGRHERDGLLPNFFTADGNPDAYNTVDSSLWYFWAVSQLLRATNNRTLIRETFWPVMESIARAFLGKTRYGIGVGDGGLLQAGDGRDALTWMDATVGGIPVTPRHGYPVEINALWYNALCFLQDLAEEFGEAPPFAPEFLPLLRRTFRERFWNPEAGCLGDVFRDGRLDTAIRPNQIFAVSLPYSPLDRAEQAAVVRAVRERLLTPCGLRTLAPDDPAYRGRYRGGPAERDGAYHQGTVWPWLLGAYGEAALRVADDPATEREGLRRLLGAFLRAHLSEAGIGCISEVFDGDAPHRPGGCISQAWSTAELLRLYRLLAKQEGPAAPDAPRGDGRGETG